MDEPRSSLADPCRWCEHTRYSHKGVPVEPGSKVHIAAGDRPAAEDVPDGPCWAKGCPCGGFELGSRRAPAPAPRVIEPLSDVELAAFAVVEAVIRRDLVGGEPARRVIGVDVQVELTPLYTRVSYGYGVGAPGARAWIAGKTLGEAFEAARAVQRRMSEPRG